MNQIDRYRHLPPTGNPRPRRYIDSCTTAAVERAVKTLDEQVAKEAAVINVIINCANAVEQLPATTSPECRRMAERVAIITSRVVGRLAR